MPTQTEELVKRIREIENRIARLEAWEGAGGPVGPVSFLSLTDTPASYVGEGLALPRVDALETAIEFWAPTVRGDVITADAIGQWSVLPLGAVGTVLQSDGTDPIWAVVPGGVIPPVARGDIIAADATPDWSVLTLGALATVLRSDGNDPAWVNPALYVPVAPVARGDIVTADAVPSWTRLALGAVGTVLRSDGNDPVWVNPALYVPVAPGAQGQAIVSDAVPAWTASLTPTWLGQHTFNVGLAIAAAQGIVVGDGGWIGAAGGASERIVFDLAGGDIEIYDAFVGIGADPPGHFSVIDLTVDTTADYWGAYLEHIKTAGATDHDDDFIGLFVRANMDHGVGEIGNFYGGRFVAQLTAGTVGDVVNTRDAYAGHFLLDLDAGVVTGAAFGVYVDVAQQAGNTVSGNLVGQRISVDADGTVTGSAIVLYLYGLSNVDYGVFQTGGLANYFGSWSGFGALTPDRRLHAQTSDQVNAVQYLFRMTHQRGIGATIAGFGAGYEFELEDAGGTNRVAGVEEALWASPAAATYLSFLRWANTDLGVSAGYGGFVAVDTVSNTVRVVVPNIAGDVTAVLTVIYAVSESAGGTSGGAITIDNGANVDIYDDGTDVLRLRVNADGSVDLTRTAGAATFDVALWMVWV